MHSELDRDTLPRVWEMAMHILSWQFPQFQFPQIYLNHVEHQSPLQNGGDTGSFLHHVFRPCSRRRQNLPKPLFVAEAISRRVHSFTNSISGGANCLLSVLNEVYTADHSRRLEAAKARHRAKKGCTPFGLFFGGVALADHCADPAEQEQSPRVVAGKYGVFDYPPQQNVAFLKWLLLCCNKKVRV